MPSDISRTSDDPNQPNTGVVAQQGRVIVDRDMNTLQRIIDTRIEAEARDVIGPSGTPDDGFAIGFPQDSPPASPPFWAPPAPLMLGPEPGLDFLVKPGTMYVGGQRVFFPPRQDGHSITYAYFDQPDWPAPAPPTLSRDFPREAVYLRVVEHELSAVEDFDLLDVALGGVDTTQRLRQMRRVERTQVQNADCALAWAELAIRWLTAGLAFDPETMRLTPTARLQVGFDLTQAPPDPCDPIATGGYLGADNQLIRVQISSPGTSGSPAEPPQLLWGYDNASFLYRVSDISADGTMLQIARDPPDAFHIPQANQAVEILRTAAIIGSEPDETDPTGQRSIIRCVAEETGFVTTLTQPYGPAASGSAAKFLVLGQALPAVFANDPNPLFVRIWQGRQSFAAGAPTDLVDPVTNAATGVQVTISTPAGELPTRGAYWEIALRPSTPQLVYPERLLASPQPPDGPRAWVCPLAVIDWRARQIHDCRQHFDNLVTLTKRPAGCCTVNIAPSDAAGALSLQVLIDRAAALAERVTVCLGPGVFALGAPLRLGAAHDNLTITACTGGVTLQAADGSVPADFGDGLVVVGNASGVTLRGLSLTMPTGALPQAMLADLRKLVPTAAGSQPRDAINTAVMIGVRAVFADGLTIEDCAFEFPQPAGAPDVIGVALFLQGDCSGLTLRNCIFDSAMPPTFSQPPPPSLGIGAPADAIATRAAAAGATPGATPVASAPSAAGAVAATSASATASAAATADATSAAAAPGAAAVPMGAVNLFNVDAETRLRLIATQFPVGIVTRAAAPAPVIATVGILAASSIVAASTPVLTTNNAASAALMCRLGDATIRGNSFANLGLAAVMFEIDGTSVRLQDNNAADCVAGLWLFLVGGVPPTGDGNLAQYNALANALLSFREAVLLLLVGEIYPLPAGVAGPLTAPVNPVSLLLANNGFEAIPGTGQGSTALFVSANRPVNAAADTSPSLVLSGNRLRSQSFRVRTPAASQAPVPTVLLVTPDNERCAITGNLILNENLKSTPGVNGGSLIVLPNSSTTVPTTGAVTSNITALAVSGNVLTGPTNLGALLRSPAAGDTWLPYNAVN